MAMETSLVASITEDQMGLSGGGFVLAHLGRVEIGKQAGVYVEHVKMTLKRMAKEQEHKAEAQRYADHTWPHTRGR